MFKCVGSALWFGILAVLHHILDETIHWWQPPVHLSCYVVKTVNSLKAVLYLHA